MSEQSVNIYFKSGLMKNVALLPEESFEGFCHRLWREEFLIGGDTAIQYNEVEFIELM